jgi:oligoendopeptidase F
MPSNLERRSWDLRSFHAAIFDAEQSRSLLGDVIEESRNAVLTSDLATLIRALERFHRSALPLVGAVQVLRETDDSPMAAQYVNAIDPMLHEARVMALEVTRLIHAAAGQEVPDELARLRPFLAALATQRFPAEQALPWAALGENYGFDALANVHRALLEDGSSTNARSATGEEVAITYQSWRALLSHVDPCVRRQTWAARQDLARRNRSSLEIIKRARLRFIEERARILGYQDVLDSELSYWRIRRSTVDILRSLDERTRNMADRYYSYKRRALACRDFSECDVAAPFPIPDRESLALQNLMRVLLEECSTRVPRYRTVLEQLLDGRTLLTDPSASRSAAWFITPNHAGGLPLVHLPYHRTLECYAAAAHEFGHACHLTDLARASGELWASDDSLVFSEIFSLYFEIVTLNAAAVRAQDESARRYWKAAVVEQALHFLRTLAIPARFEEARIAGDSPASAWKEAHARLTPAWMPLPADDDATWALQIHSEQMPLYGYGYATAFIVGYLLYLQVSPSRFDEFALRLPWQPIGDVARDVLGVDLGRAETFDLVFDHIEAQIADLE